MSKNKKTILCIDGGGIRGIIPLTILKKLHSKNNDFLNNIDIISGSSIGAVIGCALIIPNSDKTQPKYSIDEVFNIFKEKIPKIFYVSWAHWFYTFGGLFGPKYSDYYILRELETIFNDIKVKDLLKPIIIPSYDLITDKSYIFNSEDHNELYIKDILRSAVAAPTYFYPNDIKINDEKKILIDSGIVANNTSRLCFNHIIDNNYNKLDLCNDYLTNLLKYKDNIKILNIGTGKLKERLVTNNNYGLTGWAPKIVNVIMNAEISEDINECKKILGCNFLKLNCPIDIKHYDIDNISYIDYYINAVNNYIDDKKIDKYLKWVSN
jgi:patatin-like phospholipase/acyl hydrolase